MEAKARKTITPFMVAPMQSLGRAIGKKLEHGWVVHRPPGKTATPTQALAPGISAMTLNQFIAAISVSSER